MRYYIKIFIFVFIGITYSVVNAFATNIMPVEVANPDKILVENMDTTFYVIINNKEIQENVTQLKITFFNEDDKSIIIPYNWENIVKIPFHIPSIPTWVSNFLNVKVKWFYKKKWLIGFKNWKNVMKETMVNYFSYWTTFYLYTKYPYSILPSIIAYKYNKELWKNSFKPYKYNIDVSNSVSNYPTSLFRFIGTEWIEWILDNKDFLSLTNNDSNDKNNFKKYIDLNLNSSNPDCKNTYNIVKGQTKSTDLYLV